MQPDQYLQPLLLNTPRVYSHPNFTFKKFAVKSKNIYILILIKKIVKKLDFSVETTKISLDRAKLFEFQSHVSIIFLFVRVYKNLEATKECKQFQLSLIFTSNMSIDKYDDSYATFKRISGCLFSRFSCIF